jgi:hypothetical protein
MEETMNMSSVWEIEKQQRTLLQLREEGSNINIPNEKCFGTRWRKW